MKNGIYQYFNKHLYYMITQIKKIICWYYLPFQWENQKWSSSEYDFYSFSVVFTIDSEIKLSLKTDPLEPWTESSFLKSTFLIQLSYLCSNHILIICVMLFYYSSLSILSKQRWLLIMITFGYNIQLYLLYSILLLHYIINLL